MRSHGSLSMNRALMAVGLVDRVQMTLFPVPDRKFPLTDMLTGLMVALVTRTIARRPACYERDDR